MGNSITKREQDPSIEEMLKEQGEEAGGTWECFRETGFYGWEAEKVVAVTGGFNIMEPITRGKTHIAVILVKDDVGCYAEAKKYFQQAADLGLVEKVLLSTEVQDRCQIQ